MTANNTTDVTCAIFEMHVNIFFMAAVNEFVSNLTKSMTTFIALICSLWLYLLVAFSQVGQVMAKAHVAM